MFNDLPRLPRRAHRPRTPLLHKLTKLSRLAAPAALLFANYDLHAATPTAAAALGLTPIQRDVEFDTPSKADAEKCIIKAEKNGKVSGWVVYDPAGQPLRKFLDTNGDNK